MNLFEIGLAAIGGLILFIAFLPFLTKLILEMWSKMCTDWLKITIEKEVKNTKTVMEGLVRKSIYADKITRTAQKMNIPLTVEPDNKKKVVKKKKKK